MSLLSVIAADLVTLTGAGGDFAQAVTVTPHDSATTFAASIVKGDGVQSITGGPVAAVDGIVPFVGVLSLFRAGFLTATGTARNPEPGDTLTLAGDPWDVIRLDTDEGDGVTMHCRNRRAYQAGKVQEFGA